jgi:hypothetical protein
MEKPSYESLLADFDKQGKCEFLKVIKHKCLALFEISFSFIFQSN